MTKKNKILKNLKTDKIVDDNQSYNSDKSPLSLFIGSITSFVLFILFYFISNNIAVYFATHRPSNDSEIVQSISTSLNTLIIGLSFLATFSFGFIGLGLFIIFIRSFLVKNK